MSHTIGVFGLGVMGAQLARNFASRAISTLVYNRTTSVTDEFLATHQSEYLTGTHSVEEFLQKLERPRKIVLMVTAGPAVDAVLTTLLPLLEQGDILLECGNSYYKDSQRRAKMAEAHGVHFVGCGVSGGEEGALKGPSIMPGGSKESWPLIQPYLEKIAARDFSGGACVTHVGTDGAGHFVKMVHNGIEYAIMGLIASVYEIFRDLYHLTPEQISEEFKKLNEGKLASYLFEIARDCAKQKDDLTDGYLLDVILDKAGQKGTGLWTAQEGLTRAVPLSTVTEAVYSRIISGQKSLREQLDALYTRSSISPDVPLADFLHILEDALWATIVLIYAEGFHLIQTVAEEEQWTIDLSEVTRIWQGGCIIRAELLKDFHTAFAKNGSSTHLLLMKEFATPLSSALPALRYFISIAVSSGNPVPVAQVALSSFDALTKGRGSANFIQALRDNFGAHTYERIDRTGSFHSQWPSTIS